MDLVVLQVQEGVLLAVDVADVDVGVDGQAHGPPLHLGVKLEKVLLAPEMEPMLLALEGPAARLLAVDNDKLGVLRVAVILVALSVALTVTGQVVVQVALEVHHFYLHVHVRVPVHMLQGPELLLLHGGRRGVDLAAERLGRQVMPVGVQQPNAPCSQVVARRAYSVHVDDQSWEYDLNLRRPAMSFLGWWERLLLLPLRGSTVDAANS